MRVVFRRVRLNVTVKAKKCCRRYGNDEEQAYPETNMAFPAP